MSLVTLPDETETVEAVEQEFSAEIGESLIEFKDFVEERQTLQKETEDPRMERYKDKLKAEQDQSDQVTDRSFDNLQTLRMSKRELKLRAREQKASELLKKKATIETPHKKPVFAIRIPLWSRAAFQCSDFKEITISILVLLLVIVIFALARQ